MPFILSSHKQLVFYLVDKKDKNIKYNKKPISRLIIMPMLEDLLIHFEKLIHQKLFDQ